MAGGALPQRFPTIKRDWFLFQKVLLQKKTFFPEQIAAFPGQPAQLCTLIKSAYYSISQLELSL